MWHAGGSPPKPCSTTGWAGTARSRGSPHALADEVAYVLELRPAGELGALRPGKIVHGDLGDGTGEDGVEGPGNVHLSDALAANPAVERLTLNGLAVLAHQGDKPLVHRLARGLLAQGHDLLHAGLPLGLEARAEVPGGAQLVLREVVPAAPVAALGADLRHRPPAESGLSGRWCRQLNVRAAPHRLLFVLGGGGCEGCQRGAERG